MLRIEWRDLPKFWGMFFAEYLVRFFGGVEITSNGHSGWIDKRENSFYSVSEKVALVESSVILRRRGDGSWFVFLGFITGTKFFGSVGNSQLFERFIGQDKKWGNLK